MDIIDNNCEPNIIKMDIDILVRAISTYNILSSHSKLI